jgi:hypothetical protein
MNKFQGFQLKSGDITTDVKNHLLGYAIANNKIYELLHKQLYRKNRIAYVDTEFIYNGRTVKPIRFYDIKSPSTEPYDRDDQYNLGLNQFFMGQSPYDTYEGNPKDGIYHDDCQIFPKATTDHEALTYHDHYGYEYRYLTIVDDVDDEGNAITRFETVRGIKTEYSDFGEALCDNVVEENITIDEHGKKTYDLVMYLNGVEVERISSVMNLYISSRTNLTRRRKKMKYMVLDESKFGGSPTQIINFNEIQRPIADVLFRNGWLRYNMLNSEENQSMRVVQNSVYGQYRIYPDGTCLKLVPSVLTTIEISEDRERDIESDPYIEFLPLVYTDTGDLVISRNTFIEDWESMFELYVHEDSYWYIDIIPMAIIVLSFFIGYASYGIYGAIGSTISAVGAVRDNPILQVVGTVMTMGAGSYNMVIEEMAKDVALAGLTETNARMFAQRAVLDMSFQQFAYAFVNYAGMSNLISIGSTMLSSALIIKEELDSKDYQDDLSTNTPAMDDNTTKYINNVIKSVELQT